MRGHRHAYTLASPGPRGRPRAPLGLIQGAYGGPPTIEKARARVFGISVLQATRSAQKRGGNFRRFGRRDPLPPPPRGVPASFMGASLPPARGQDQLFAQGHDTGPIQPPASPRGPELLARGEDAGRRARAWGRRRRGRGRPPRPLIAAPPPRGQEQLFAQGHDTGPFPPPVCPEG